MSVHYTDSTLNVPQGLFQSYYINAVLEKEGSYDNGLMQGLWQQWNDKGLKTDSIIYDKDIRIRFAKFEYYSKEKIMRSYAFTDSLANTYTQLYFYKKGNLSSVSGICRAERFVENAMIVQVLMLKQILFSSREEIEASFPGGAEGWKDFLKKNLRGDVPSDKGAPNGLYTVDCKIQSNQRWNAY